MLKKEVCSMLEHAADKIVRVNIEFCFICENREFISGQVDFLQTTWLSPVTTLKINQQ